MPASLDLHISFMNHFLIIPLLLMSKTANGWQLDDMRFGGEWDFANKGT